MNHQLDAVCWLLITVVLAAFLVTIPGIGNGFAFDDVPVIALNTALHSPGTSLDRAFDPYLGGQLLRPVPQLFFALQWWVGDGNPLIFRLVNMGLYALVCVLVFLLIRRAGASLPASFLGALVFTVHPVHSEVTANGVGQLELLTTAVVLAASCWYLYVRVERPWRRVDTLVIATCLVIATHTKEVGYVLPVLLVALELMVIRDPRPWGITVARLREPALVLTAVFLGSLAVRKHFLGSLGGGDAHQSLLGLGLVERTRTVLMLIPEWGRLLLWPARLQAEYGPPALDPGSGIGTAHALGLLCLVATVTILVRCYRRQPAVSLGLAWILVGLAPVANLLFPTGILVAERTLFLPSVGLAIALAATTDQIRLRLVHRPHLKGVGLAGTTVLLLLAGWRSADRQPDWRDTVVLLSRDAQTAPHTYRLHYLLGQEHQSRGNVVEAELAFDRAAGLWARDPRPFSALGQLLRARGECGEAIQVLGKGVLADSTDDQARSRLVECLIVGQRWDEAEREAERGLAQGVSAYQNALTRVRAGREADSQADGRQR